MKKILLIALCLMVLLCACGKEEPNDAQQPDSGSATQESTEATGEPLTGEERKALAQTCVGKTVEELYALIGEPNSADYATSCMGPGEDGNLYYDDFTVYTYKEGDVETVRIVD